MIKFLVGVNYISNRPIFQENKHLTDQPKVQGDTKSGQSNFRAKKQLPDQMFHDARNHEIMQKHRNIFNYQL